MTSVSLAVNGKRLSQWKSVSVSRSLTALADSFTLDYVDTITNEDYPIDTGDQCVLYIGNNRVVTGYVDVVDFSYSAGSGSSTHGFRVMGRSRTADLYDSSAVPSPAQYQQKTFKVIAEQVCSDFGIAVEFTSNVDSLVTTPIKRQSVEVGESVGDFLGRIAQKLGVLLTSTAEGKLLIGRPPVVQSGSGLMLGPGGRVKGGRRTKDHRERHSVYIAFGQRQGSPQALGAAAKDGKQSAKDPRVQRYRPLVWVQDGSSDSGTLLRASEWRRNTRAGQSERVSYTVQGWEHSPGQPWEPGLTVFVEDKFLRLSRVGLIIESCNFTFSESGGSETQIDLVLPEAFQSLSPPTEPKIRDGVMTW